MMDNPQGDGKNSAMLKKHNNSPQVQDAMPPRGHGVKDNEEDQSCYKSFSGLSQVPLIYPLGCGCGSGLRGTANTNLFSPLWIGQASDEKSFPCNKQT